MNPQDPNYARESSDSANSYVPPRPPEPPQPVVQPPQQPYTPVSPPAPASQPVPPTPIPTSQPTETPQNINQNPYSFILSPNQNQPKKTSLLGALPGGKILLVIGGLILLTIIIVVAVSLLTPKSSIGLEMTKIAQQEQEIVRISKQVASRASAGTVKNYAITVEISIITNQKKTLAYLDTQQIKINSKLLGAGRDDQTDKLLKDAAATSTYDQVSVTQLNRLLSDYRNAVQNTRDIAPGKTSRDLMTRHFDVTEKLLIQGNDLASPGN